MFLNMLRDEDFAAKIQYMVPFEFRMTYRNMICYNECVKGNDIMIKDLVPTKKFVRDI